MSCRSPLPVRRRSNPTERARSGAGRIHGRGFTIIELMLVIGLLAVLMAIAYPVYNNYRARVNSSHAVMQISMMSTSIQNYYNDRRAYPNDLSDVGMSGAQDPWGRPYAYYNIEANGKGGARKDHALNPINTDFDLFSPGPDGQSKSQITQKSSVDDVIRASNGRFIGVAADFAAP